MILSSISPTPLLGSGWTRPKPQSSAHTLYLQGGDGFFFHLAVPAQANGQTYPAGQMFGPYDTLENAQAGRDRVTPLDD